MFALWSQGKRCHNSKAPQGVQTVFVVPGSKYDKLVLGCLNLHWLSSV